MSLLCSKKSKPDDLSVVSKRVAFEITAAICFATFFVIALVQPKFSLAADLVTIEAESGVLGSNYTNGIDGATHFISISTDTVSPGTSPGNTNRIATYNVTFPAAGTYKLYGRVRVGSGNGSDDSFFYANGFGNKTVNLDTDWILNNNWNVGGFTSSSDVVTGSGSAGINIWKWVSLSDYTGGTGETPISFTVPEGSLTQTFQIGARENGFDIDKFVFATVGTSLAVSNLDAGTLPPEIVLTNIFSGPEGTAFHRFNPLSNGLNLDGANPAAGLVLFGDVLCGTTLNGGMQGAGTAFYLSLDGTSFTAFRSFTNTPDAGNPLGELALSENQFFGTTICGSTNGDGVVFVGQTNGNVSVLRSFASVDANTATNFGGASPSALLAMSGGTLYGTATAGGSGANGTIFSLTTNGATFSVLHDFSVLDLTTGTNADGALPQGGLILSGDRLYGTASGGGDGGNGVVFSLRTNGTEFTTLHSFSPTDSLAATNTDGAMPIGGLVLWSNKLYGTTSAGGLGGRGTMFSIETNGLDFTVLHQFSMTDSTTSTNADGASPVAALTSSGTTLYGTASSGGTGAAGTVFALNLSGGQFTIVHSFTPMAANGTNTDGAFPVAPVLRVGDTLYGTTFGGGPGGVGTVFGLALPKPPAVIGITPNQNGTLSLNFSGAPNSTNVIQATANLAGTPNWQNISTNVADSSGVWQLTQTNLTKALFYRSYAL